MEDEKLCIFAPPGTYFMKCEKCSAPCMQYYSSPGTKCIWCELNLDPLENLDDADVDS